MAQGLGKGWHLKPQFQVPVPLGASEIERIVAGLNSFTLIAMAIILVAAINFHVRWSRRIHREIRTRMKAR